MVREILYTVTENTKEITPATKQWAGMQYEDNATEVIFDLSALKDKLKNPLYRVDFNSSSAGYQPSENLDISDNKISRKLPLAITQYGGEVQITAVITETNDNGEETGVLYSYPVTVYFTAVKKSAISESKVVANISAMEENVKKLEKSTKENAEEAKESAEQAEEAQKTAYGYSGTAGISATQASKYANSAMSASLDAISAKNAAVEAQKFAESAKATVKILEGYTSQFASQSQHYAENANKAAERAYSAAEKAVLDNSSNLAPAIKGAAQGQTIVLDDISPIEHELKVKLFAEPKEGNIYTSVPVDMSKIKDKNGNSVENVDTITFTKANNKYSFKSLKELCVDENGNCPLSIGDTVVIKWKYSSNYNYVYDGYEVSLNNFKFKFSKLSEESGSENIECVSEPFEVEDIMLNGVDILGMTVPINLVIENLSGDAFITLSELQVSKLSNELIDPDYTKMVLTAEGETKKITYTPQADGTVLGVKSLYPSLTLRISDEDATIDCCYNKDTNRVLEGVAVDQTYNPESENAQSGKAVAEVIALTKKDSAYELIEEFTVAEGDSFNVLLRETEPDGTPYNFKHLLIKCVMEKSAKISGTYVDLIETKYLIPCILYTGNFIATDTGRTTYIKFDSENGLIFTQTYNSNSVTGNGTPTVSQNAFGRVAGNIKGFRVRLSNSDTTLMFPAGSKITILGVRA